VAPQAVPRVVSSDPDDDHVLAAALAACADLIASGDRRDLLPLGSYEGIPIITAREALQRLELGKVDLMNSVHSFHRSKVPASNLPLLSQMTPFTKT
jgi:hypothetical protein